MFSKLKKIYLIYQLLIKQDYICAMENLEEVIFYKLENAIKTYRQLAQRNITTAGLDLTVDQWLIMKVLLEKGGLKQSEIAEKVFKDAASVTRIIDLLINKEYLLREVHDNDRRRSQLRLTAKGKSILSKVQVIIQNNRKLALNEISEGKIKEMSKTLSTIISNCKSKQSKMKSSRIHSLEKYMD